MSKTGEVSIPEGSWGKAPQSSSKNGLGPSIPASERRSESQLGLKHVAERGPLCLMAVALKS